MSATDDEAGGYAHAAPAQLAAHSPSVGRRLQQTGASSAPAAGQARFAGSVVGCRGSDCRGYRMQVSGWRHACLVLAHRGHHHSPACKLMGCSPVSRRIRTYTHAGDACAHTEMMRFCTVCREAALASLWLHPSLLPRRRRWPGGAADVPVRLDASPTGGRLLGVCSCSWFVHRTHLLAPSPACQPTPGPMQ